jgi:nicotinate-nucleotide pyrophosphorylase (carboxylating)
MDDFDEQFYHLVIEALKEDVGDGDYSTLSCISSDARGKAILKIKQNGILAGMMVAEKIFKYKDPTCIFTSFKNDGDKTRQYVDKLKGFKTKVLDTRKTTPNFRLLEKEAVRIGGGVNHRFGLFDMIMLKDNHIDFCGGIEKAIKKAYEYVLTNKTGLKIEVETRNLDEVKKVVAVGKGKVFRVMMDNFKTEQIHEAIKIIDGQFETEASGGITLDNIDDYAKTGVDYISVGALIHQATSLDMSLKAVPL